MITEFKHPYGGEVYTLWADCCPMSRREVEGYGETWAIRIRGSVYAVLGGLTAESCNRRIIPPLCIDGVDGKKHVMYYYAPRNAAELGVGELYVEYVEGMRDVVAVYRKVD